MAKIPAIHFEARKIGWRQSKDGLVVSFVIHPDDVNADFAVAALGTRYMVALAKIGDDEQPEPIRVQTVDKPANDPAEARKQTEALDTRSALHVTAHQDEHYKGVKSDPERRRFSELPLPQQVALRCNDERFQHYLCQRAEEPDPTMEKAAELVRGYCHVRSRADIQPGTPAAAKWAYLESDFLASTGQMAEQYR